MGLRHAVIHRFAVDPTVIDDSSVMEGAAPKYKIGDVWLNMLTNELFEVFDLAVGAAVWISNLSNITLKDTIIKDSAKLTPAPLTAHVNNYNPTGWIIGGKIDKTILRLATDGSGNKRVSGIIPSIIETGNVFTVVNIGTVNNIIIRNNDGLSTDISRFIMNAHVTLAPNEAATFHRDTVDLRWRQSNDYK